MESSKTYSNSGLQLGVGTRQVLTGLDSLPHATVDALPVGAAEHGTRAEKGKRIVLSTCVVHGDVPQHVLVDLLGEIDVDTQEVCYDTSSAHSPALVK